MRSLALLLIFLFFNTVMTQVVVAQIYPPEKPMYRIADERIKEDWEHEGITGKNPDGSGGWMYMKEIQKLIDEGFYRETPEGLVFTLKGKIFFYLFKIRAIVRDLCSGILTLPGPYF